MSKFTTMLLLIIVASIGCQSAGNRVQKEIDKLPWRGDTPIAPTLPPEPVPSPPPAEDLQMDGFLWEPGPDSVRIIIPASLPHWQLTLVTLNTHHTIYGPDNAGRGQSGDVEYILPGSGADWQALASVTCQKGYPAIMVYINTDSMQTTGHRSAGWRILSPTYPTTGNCATRLQLGENK